ncbi:MAG TPA: D-alanyl-D-alanine endopeptidase [Steroidobacteraceae bacterium]|nr:D-alanyl-D-alanine endopeptidase [Steroidobacteraceae bacterium]
MTADDRMRVRATTACAIGAIFVLCAPVLARPTRGHVFRGPGVRSSAALVIDTSDSTVLYAKRAEAVQPIASITKLMTALVVLDAKQPLGERITIKPADRIHGKGWYSRLKVGTTLTRRDLLHLALMSSENRAARTLADNYPGGFAAAIRAMNAKAKALGMRHTHFADPTGLTSRNVSTPGDLAKLVIAASHNPTIREFSTARRFAVRVRHRLVEFGTTDRLVANRAWKIIVQKTGFINAAGHCLVMETVIEGRKVVIVLLDSWGRYTRVADAVRVRRWIEAGGLDERGRRVSMR